MAFIYDLADTWNDGVTTFNGIRLNVTDTASNAASNLLDLQVGGVSRFRVTKTGKIVIFQGGIDLINQNGNTQAIATDSGNRFLFADKFSMNTGNGLFIAAGSIGLSSGSAITSADLILARDAANTLAQRNGVNAQAFNLYNTYTDASNYERGFMRYSSNRLDIGTEALGTGSVRDLRLLRGGSVGLDIGQFQTILYAAGTASISLRSGGSAVLSSSAYTWVPAGTISDGYDTSLVRSAAAIVGVRGGSSTTGGSLEFLEQTAPAAPATNNVRIYAEDDGAGKTRLMARFATGAAVQIAIEP